MRVVHTEPGGGRVILDPVRLPDIVTNSARGFANGVLTPEHLVASTVPLSSHHECAAAAGIELDDVDWLDPVPGTGHVRLQMDAREVEAEFWYDEGVYAGATCPLSVESLSAMADWMAGHPALIRAYGGAPPVRITLLHDGLRLWSFHGGTVHDTDDTPSPCEGPRI